MTELSVPFMGYWKGRPDPLPRKRDEGMVDSEAVEKKP